MDLAGAPGRDPRTGRALCFGARFVVQWHLTDRCNLRCRHCYHEGPPRPALDPAARRAVLAEVAEFLARRGLRGRIHFAGGEPFADTDLVPLVRDAVARGFTARVLTNGTMIRADAARALAAAGCGGVQVSVEGPAAAHDAVRGPGSLAAALAGARCAQAAGVPVTLAMTVHRDNVGAVGALPDLAAGGAAARLYYARLVPLGRGAELAVVTRREWHGALRRVLAIARARRLEVALRDPTFRPLTLAPAHAAAADAVGGCAAGYRTLTIEADGTVMACRRLGVALGRLGEQRLDEIWEEHEDLTALRDRDRLRGACGACPYRWVCGGCRAVALAVAGDALAADPQCPWPLWRVKGRAGLRALGRRAAAALAGVPAW
ncbi:MAG TPA: radical SAM protein [Polyangia bacterium]|jgi:radical SAM protein with 4Fe4S-binding SPASM domain